MVIGSLSLMTAAMASSATNSTSVSVDEEKVLREIASSLSRGAVDPFEPFHLSAGSSIQTVENVASVVPVGYLGAGEAVYLQMSLASSPGQAALLPSPDGMQVVQGQLFFVGEGRLIEATLTLDSTANSQQALEELSRQIGPPEFSMTLPGSIDLFVGWRFEKGCALATFDDSQRFQLSAFAAEPDDALVGPQLVLFDHLSQYARRKSEGVAEDVLVQDLLEVVGWLEAERSNIRPVE